MALNTTDRDAESNHKKHLFSNLSFFYRTNIQKAYYCTFQLQESIETTFLGPGGFDLGGAYVPLGHLLFQGKWN